MWDWLMAALAVVSVLALPTSVLRAVTTVADQPDGVSLALAVVYVASGAAWGWWMGVGSWRLTYWARRTKATRASAVAADGGSVDA